MGDGGRQPGGCCLTVSVADNPAQERRTASLAVNPQGNIKVKPRSVTIAQAGNDTPVVYSLTVEPAALTFEPENAPAQEVKVTTEGEGLMWSTEVEEVARGWITVTERDGGFTVVVADNPGQAPRSGNITRRAGQRGSLAEGGAGDAAGAGTASVARHSAE